MQINVNGAGYGTMSVDLSLCKFIPKSLGPICLFARNKLVNINITSDGIRVKFTEPYVVSVWISNGETSVHARSGIDTTPYVRMVNELLDQNWSSIESDIKACEAKFYDK